jgi:hypothetical protein
MTSIADAGLKERNVSTTEQIEGVTALGDNNNAHAGNLPPSPNPALRKLDRLVGRWTVDGSSVLGQVEYEWMEGGFFLIQHVDLTAFGRPIKGVEYIGFDEDTETLRSHFMDNNGSNFTYTWDLEGDTLRIWFGEKDSDNHFRGTFDETGNSYRGRWQWPDGRGGTTGYEVTLTRA